MARLTTQYYGKERTLLDHLYDTWPVGKEVQNVNQATLLPSLGDSATGKAIRQFEAIGILSKRLEYGTPEKGNFGRHYHYTLLLSREDARQKLEDSIYTRASEAQVRYEKANKASADKRRGMHIGGRKAVSADAVIEEAKAVVSAAQAEMIGPEDMAHPVAIAANDKEEVRAIAGEDAPSTMRTELRKAFGLSGKPDEAAALIAAASQYAHRDRAFSAKVAELRALAEQLGMTVDVDALQGAVSIERDERLETISLVLPYINAQDSRIETLGRQIAEQREKLRGYDDLRAENKRLRDQNARLLASRVSGAMAQA